MYPCPYVAVSAGFDGGIVPNAATFNTSPLTLGDGTAASFVITTNLSGALDPTITLSNQLITLNPTGTSATTTINNSVISNGNATSFGWGSSIIAANNDTSMCRAGVGNSIIYNGAATAAAGSSTSRTEINKAVTAFTNAVAKTVFTLTIPNAAHSASYLVRLTGSIGAGGAIGPNEASATNCYIVTLTRTPGANATAAISAAFGAAATAVAGATTVTCTGALAAVSGGVGAVNTIDLQATITRGGGSSDNHTIVATASLLNANATGITIA
jgi:hypothetical protein